MFIWPCSFAPSYLHDGFLIVIDHHHNTNGVEHLGEAEQRPSDQQAVPDVPPHGSADKSYHDGGGIEYNGEDGLEGEEDVDLLVEFAFSLGLHHSHAMVNLDPEDADEDADPGVVAAVAEEADNQSVVEAVVFPLQRYTFYSKCSRPANPPGHLVMRQPGQVLRKVEFMHLLDSEPYSFRKRNSQRMALQCSRCR